jgi:carotene epsilon-monooxygenase
VVLHASVVFPALQEEVDRVLGSSDMPSMQQYAELKYILRCVNESMRLYPHPPVLLRRARVPDTLPGGYEVVKGQDVMISVYNIHHSPQVGFASFGLLWL